MPWLADVAPYDTIQSLWGNTVRDRIVHPFASRAERNAQAAPKQGTMCWCQDVATLYVWHNSAWVVVQMPWRNYTAKAWAVDPNNVASRLPLNVTGQVKASWRQCLGVCQVSADYQAALQPNTSPVSYWLAVGGPATDLNSGTGGAVYAYNATTGLMHGGACSWLANDTPTGSVFLLNNVGPGVPPNSTVQSTTGPGAVSLGFGLTLTYACDPTFDP